MALMMDSRQQGPWCVSGEPCSCSGFFLLPAPHVEPQGLPHLPCSLAPFSAPPRAQQSCTHSLTHDRVPCAPGMADAEVNTHGRVETGEGGGRPPAESRLKTPSFSQDNGSESPGTLFLGAPCGSDKPCWWGPEALPTPPLVVSAQLTSPLDRQPPPLQSPDNLRSDHCCILQARKPQVPPSHGVPFTARTEGDTHPPAGALPSGHLEQPCSSRSQVSSW